MTVVPCKFSVATLAADDDGVPGLGAIGWNKLRGEVGLCVNDAIDTAERIEKEFAECTEPSSRPRWPW